MGSEPDEISVDIEYNDEKKLLLKIISELPDKEKELMKKRFGIFGEKEHTQKQLADLMGISQSYISRLEKKILEKIEFKFEGDQIIAPSFRNDIEHIADISEEVARFYGYHNIPNRVLSGVAIGKLTDKQKFTRTINDTLLACGCSEVSTFSFISPKAYDRINLKENSKMRESVVISNPLGEDTSVMRTTILPSMLNVLARNYNHKNEKASLYEIGTVYTPTEKGKLPVEKQKIAIGMYGKDADFYTLKGGFVTSRLFGEKIYYV